LEKAQQEKNISIDEIDTQHPGYLIAQDTFYVGYIKGVGRIYQQSVLDTYSAVGFAKLYTVKVPVTAADILNDKVLLRVKMRGDKAISSSIVYEDNINEAIETMGGLSGLIRNIFFKKSRVLLYSWSGHKTEIE
jgi:hypothetical protein